MISGNIISQIFGLSSTKRKFLSFFNLFIASFFAFSSLANGQNLEDGLVAWYPFDGNASDMSGNGNHGTVNGATLGVDRHGQSNRAYSFDGVNDFIDCGNGPSLQINDAITISVWFATNDVSEVRWILGKNRDVTSGFHIRQYNSSMGGHLWCVSGSPQGISVFPQMEIGIFAYFPTTRIAADIFIKIVCLIQLL